MSIYDDEQKKTIPVTPKRTITNDGAGSYATNQFFGILDSEPANLDHSKFDNPPFDWPSKKLHYVDGVNKTTPQEIQRGYMRSLITDPHVGGNIVAGEIQSPNRRLFFQFNPQAIRRDVSQTPGAMLPLLQSPEQLMQAVPGVSTFGFSLMFNREAEVNKGLLTDGNTVLLPNGQQSLVSQVGVLADILVLDTITGQGISSDLIQSVARQQSDFLTQQVEEEKKALKGLTKSEILDRQSFTTLGDVSSSAIEEKYNVNIGNSAFLNPLPFRVMFSTLFMVEGIATNVGVTFTKFSQNMVPTQCTVDISMYALYIGFAKKKTFLYENLLNTAKDTGIQITKDEEVINKLKVGLSYVNFYKTEFDDAYYERGEGFYVSIDATRTTNFSKEIEKKNIKDVMIRVKIYARLSLIPLTKDHDSLTNATCFDLTYKDSNDIPLSKVTDPADRALACSELVNVLLTEKKVTENKKTYLSYMYSVEIAGSGDTGVSVSAPLFYSEVFLNARPFDTTGIKSYGKLIAKNTELDKDNKSKDEEKK